MKACWDVARPALLFVLTIFVISYGGSVVLSQQPNQADFPKDQVEEANKELDLFLENETKIRGLPFKITNYHRKVIINKYLNEAGRSPYFWNYLSDLFVDSIKPAVLCPGCWNGGEGFLKERERENYVLHGVMTSSWGTLILSSEPMGADVFLKRYGSTARLAERTFLGLAKEGQTTIKRKYPQDRYTFVLELNGHKSKEIEVNIVRDAVLEQKIVLEKQ